MGVFEKHMEKTFEIFKDKLGVDLDKMPGAQFCCVDLTFGGETFEFFVVVYSYLVSKGDAKEERKNKGDLMPMDIEMNNFVKVFVSSYAHSEGNLYNFVAKMNPLAKVGDVLGNSNIDLASLNIRGDSFVRTCLCVSYPVQLEMSEQAALDIGLRFSRTMDMMPIGIEEIQSLYNKTVEDELNQSNEEMYCFYLDNLGDLLEMPFRSKGKVYENNKKNQPPYIYETDTVLFDFLDEYDGSKVRLCEMDVVLEDVGKLIDALR